MEGIYLSPALPTRWLLMGQSVQAPEPTAGTQALAGGVFVASSWPVASLLLAHPPSPRSPPWAPFLNGRYR